MLKWICCQKNKKQNSNSRRRQINHDSGFIDFKLSSWTVIGTGLKNAALVRLYSKILHLLREWRVGQNVYMTEQLLDTRGNNNAVFCKPSNSRLMIPGIASTVWALLHHIPSVACLCQAAWSQGGSLQWFIPSISCYKQWLYSTCHHKYSLWHTESCSELLEHYGRTWFCHITTSVLCFPEDLKTLNQTDMSVIVI